jgi:hypothetical protein
VDRVIELELEREELLRDRLIQQSKMAASAAQKIQISSRYRKLVDTNHLGVKERAGQIWEASEKGIGREEKEYMEIATDIKLNNLQSKVMIDVHSPKGGNILHGLKEDESLQMPSPSPNASK